VIGFGEMEPPGQATGNPLHCAPEQFGPNPGPIGPRTDVYQLAETAAWLLAGEHPFDVGRSAERVLAAKQAADGWRTGRLRNLPRAVTTTFRRALSPDPAARYPSAGEFAAALAEAVHERRRAWRVW
jgi:eukaryotic-like serine/threonine-protein kinase